MRKKPLARNAEVYTAMRSRFSGIDIVPEIVRLCAMNLYLHDIASRESPIEARDALLGAGGQTYDVILTNPPFGKKTVLPDCSRRRRDRYRARGLRSPGFLRHDLEQAAQFPAAHYDRARRERQCCSSNAATHTPFADAQIASDALNATVNRRPSAAPLL
jgi:hypothetical protein